MTGPIEGNCPHGNYAPACKRCKARRDTEVICDRCLRVPGVASDGRTPYCHLCMHECTFSRGQIENGA